MKQLCTSCVFLVFWQFTFGQIVINEIDVDTPGIDTEEFIELRSDAPNFALDDYVLVFFNGSSSGADSSYFTIDLDGAVTDENGLLLIGSAFVTPYPQLVISANVIQNGADAVGLYLGSFEDFPEMTLATQTNLIDAIAYDTSDADDTELMALLGLTEQINEGSSNNTNSIQRNNDGTYFTGTPSPRVLNDGSGTLFNPINITVTDTQFDEGASFDITFTSQDVVTADVSFNVILNNGTFDTLDFTGNTNLTIANGETSTSTTINLIDDANDEGDEELMIAFSGLQSPYIPFNNNVIVRVVDNDFTMAAWGKPTNPTFGLVESTQPNGYYTSLDGLADLELRLALQSIVANPDIVRAQTYNDVTDILKTADQNPENSNQVWLVYTEQGRPKLDFQTTSDNTGKWNREHTYPRSRGGFFNIEEDEIADGPDIFWTTKADSLRHANSDAHALRAADGAENSQRGNQHYGQYNGPTGTLGSFKGDVARGVLFLEIRYNGLEVVDGFPNTTGQLGDLETLLDWHRNDPPDDFEMNRNNIIYTWQINRNPFIDQPDLVEYIWGNNVGEEWTQPLSTETFDVSRIKLFPNPASNKVTIKGVVNTTRIVVYSSEGRQVLSQMVHTDTTLNLNLTSGMYYVKLMSEGSTLTAKLIID